MTAISPDDLLARLSGLETGQVSDVLDEAGIPNHALSSDLMALSPGKSFAGRAACVRGAPVVQAGATVPTLPADILEQVAQPGTVLFIETGGFRGGAVLGGFVAYSLQRNGCRGIVTDGAVRDADEIREMEMPCIARTITPVNGARRWRLMEANVSVAIAGQSGATVTIAPGDLVLADGDGVIVVPAGVAHTVIEDAETLRRIEARIGEELHGGGSRAQVFKANPRFDHIHPATYKASVAS